MRASAASRAGSMPRCGLVRRNQSSGSTSSAPYARASRACQRAASLGGAGANNEQLRIVRRAPRPSPKKHDQHQRRTAGTAACEAERAHLWYRAVPRSESCVLEQIVQKFRGVVLLLVVFALSAVFMLQFGGPQAKGCSQGGTTPAAKVVGRTISRSEFQAAYVLAGGENYPDEMAKQYKLREMVLYGLIERDLLAREARKLGFDISEDEVMKKVAEDGTRAPARCRSTPARTCRRRARSASASRTARASSAKRTCATSSSTVCAAACESSRSEQTHETLAQRMRDAVSASVSVGPGEVWDAFVREKESAKLKYVRFSPVYYGQQYEPTAQDIAAYRRVARQGRRRRVRRATSTATPALEKQVRARHILIKVDASAGDEAKQAARKKAEGLLARAQEGRRLRRARARVQRRHRQRQEGRRPRLQPQGPHGRAVRRRAVRARARPDLRRGRVDLRLPHHQGRRRARRRRAGGGGQARAGREAAARAATRRAGEAGRDACCEQKVAAGATLEDALAAITGSAHERRRQAPARTRWRRRSRDARVRPHGYRDRGSVRRHAAGQGRLRPERRQAPARCADAARRRLVRVPPREQDQRGQGRLHPRRASPHPQGLLRRKRSEAIKSYVRELREQAIADKDISVDEALLNGTAQPLPQSEPDS